MTEPTLSPEEQARRNRVHDLADHVALGIVEIIDNLKELGAVGVPPMEGIILSRDRLPPEAKANVDSILQRIGEPKAAAPADPAFGSKIRLVIERLFAEAPKLDDASGKAVAGQAPALECHVLLRGGREPLWGTLSVTPEGTLRMMTPSMMQREQSKPPVPILCESFFEYGEVISIMVEREVKASGSRIIAAS